MHARKARMAELQYGIIPDLERSLEMVDQHGKKENQLLRNKVTDEEIAAVEQNAVTLATKFYGASCDRCMSTILHRSVELR